jgi:2-iminobutanoate/2-iminopropanoate deaminase
MSERSEVQTSAAPAAMGPYSQGIRTEQLVFASGQTGTSPATGELAEGVAAQAERAIQNLEAVLDAAGSSPDRVVKTTIFLVDMGDFSTVNEVYARHFPVPYPARSTVCVKALPKGALVEVEAVALREES